MWQSCPVPTTAQEANLDNRQREPEVQLHLPTTAYGSPWLAEQYRDCLESLHDDLDLLVTSADLEDRTLDALISALARVEKLLDAPGNDDEPRLRSVVEDLRWEALHHHPEAADTKPEQAHLSVTSWRADSALVYLALIVRAS